MPLRYRYITDPHQMTLQIPAGLKKSYITLGSEDENRYYPLRFRVSKQETQRVSKQETQRASKQGESQWQNNWYAVLGDLDTPLTVELEPYEPGLLVVSCRQPDGTPLPQCYLSVKYQNVEFEDPKTITSDGRTTVTGIERYSPQVEFAAIDNVPVMRRYRPVLADEEFVLSVEGFNKTQVFKPVTQTVILKSAERRQIEVTLKETVQGK